MVDDSRLEKLHELYPRVSLGELREVAERMTAPRSTGGYGLSVDKALKLMDDAATSISNQGYSFSQVAFVLAAAQVKTEDQPQPPARPLPKRYSGTLSVALACRSAELSRNVQAALVRSERAVELLIGPPLAVLERLGSQRIDVILLEIEASRTESLSRRAALRARSSAPIIAVGAQDNAVAFDLLMHGFDDYLAADHVPAWLLERLGVCLGWVQPQLETCPVEPHPEPLLREMIDGDEPANPRLRATVSERLSDSWAAAREVAYGCLRWMGRHTAEVVTVIGAAALVLAAGWMIHAYLQRPVVAATSEAVELAAPKRPHGPPGLDRLLFIVLVAGGCMGLIYTVCSRFMRPPAS